MLAEKERGSVGRIDEPTNVGLPGHWRERKGGRTEKMEELEKEKERQKEEHS